MIPQRLFDIVSGSDNAVTAHFPPTEIFNEGWMLRLTLDAVQSLNIQNHPLCFLSNARWFSEARLASPFRPRTQRDPLGEGYTNADGVIGHFDFNPQTKAGLKLSDKASQFVVVEAKLHSPLSAGTRNVPGYHQAARNVACMAQIIQKSGRQVSDFESLGFFVIAPAKEMRRPAKVCLEDHLDSSSIQTAVHERIKGYEDAARTEEERTEATKLREWENQYFQPLLSRLAQEQRLDVLSWEESTAIIRAAGSQEASTASQMLDDFYQRCLVWA